MNGQYDESPERSPIERAVADGRLSRGAGASLGTTRATLGYGDGPANGQRQPRGVHLNEQLERQNQLVHDLLTTSIDLRDTLIGPMPVNENGIDKNPSVEPGNVTDMLIYRAHNTNAILRRVLDTLGQIGAELG